MKSILDEIAQIFSLRARKCLLHSSLMNVLHTSLLWFFLSVISLQAASLPVKVEVTVNDQIRFSTKRIEGKVGVPMQITLKHTGRIPKTSMSHNLVIVRPGTMVAMISAKCSQAKDTNYVAMDAETKSAILAATPQLGPGESHTITFTPKEAGIYPFLCTYPGHFGEMNGVIEVKE